MVRLIEKMRKTLVLLVLSCSSVAVMAAGEQLVSNPANMRASREYVNPVIHADYSDPDVVASPDGKTFYMTASSFQCTPGLPILRSHDLVNWTLVNYALDSVPPVKFYGDNIPRHGKGVWAPCIKYHNGEYYIYWGDPDFGIFMTKSANPEGKWSTSVLVRAGKGLIDPSPYWDADGKAYLSNGWAASRAGFNSILTLSEMTPDGTALMSTPKIIYDGNDGVNHTVEGTKLYHHGDYYYLFAPAGGVIDGWQLVMRSKNIYGPYESKIVMAQGKSDINGPHQGAWVDTVTGQDWFLHFQDVYAGGRIVHLQPMHWENDWPIIGINKPGNDYGEPVMEYTKPDIGKSNSYPVCEPDTSDDFTSDKLGMQWQWNANPQKDWYELTGSALKLNAVDAVPLRPVSDYRNLLLQKWPAPEFTCVTKMQLSGMENGDVAGVVSLGTEYGALAVEKRDNKYTVRQILGTQYFDCDMPYTTQNSNDFELSESDFKDTGKTVTFRYTVKCTGHIDHMELSLPVKAAPVEELTLELSFDGKNYEKAFSFASKAGRWVGVKNGIFCAHDNTVKNDKTGYVLVDSVEYMPKED